MATKRKDKHGHALREGESIQADGMYRYQYVDERTKKRKVFRSSTLEGLREKERQLLKDQLDDIDYGEANTVTLNIVFDRYMQTKDSLKESTATNYIYMYNRFVRNTLGTRKVAAIKYSDVLRFYQRLLNEGHIQINTLDTIHCALHPAFTMAVRDGIIRSNPSDGVMGDLKKSTDYHVGVRHALTVDQQRSFMHHCRQSKEYSRWAPLLTVLLGTGCRVGEIIGLRWDDVDFENRIISINHSVSYHSRRTGINGTRCEYKVTTPKTKAGIRDVPMMDTVYNALIEERDFQQQTGFCTAMVDGMSGFIFQNRYGNIHNPHAINRAIERIRLDCNQIESHRAVEEKRSPVVIPHFSCHHLRHTFCSRFCERETNVKVIQAVMGHADIQTTMNIYAEVTNAKMAAAVTDLAKNLDVF